MNEEYEPWVESTLNSMAGSRRAQPPAHLLGRIEAEIYQDATLRRMTVAQWGRLAIAASLLLLLNGWVFYQYLPSTSSVGEEENPYALVSNYNYYQ